MKILKFHFNHPLISKGSYESYEYLFYILLDRSKITTHSFSKKKKKKKIKKREKYLNI